MQVPDGVLIDAAIAETLPYDRVVYVCTGSQGEPLAVLSRMADGTFQIVPGPGDRVIFASSLIPGNESSVYKLMDKLYDLGAEVSHKGNAFVHVSGHCASGELLYCYNILKPKFAMPIHGERRHLVANKRVAEKAACLLILLFWQVMELLFSWMTRVLGLLIRLTSSLFMLMGTIL